MLLLCLCACKACSNVNNEFYSHDLVQHRVHLPQQGVDMGSDSNLSSSSSYNNSESSEWDEIQDIINESLGRVLQFFIRLSFTKFYLIYRWKEMSLTRKQWKI